MKCFNFRFQKIIFSSTLILFTLLPFTHAQETPFTLSKKGAAFIQEGNFLEAAKVLQEALALKPADANSVTARYLLGLAQYNLGNYAETVKQLTDSKDFIPEVKPIAAFHLGAAHYFLGNPDKALLALDQVVKSTNVEIIPIALLYQARSHMDIGNKLAATDKVRSKQAYASGVVQASELITKFPQDENVLDALMIKANLNALSGNFDAAAASAEDFKTRPGSSAMMEDADYLLAAVYSQQAATLRADFKKEEALESIKKAQDIYKRLLLSENLIVANDAAFQLANLSFAGEDYAVALQEFRALRSKSEVIESQEKRIVDLRKKVIAAAGNTDLSTNLKRILQREESKLKVAKENTDSAMDALIRIADCFVQLKKYDEARTIHRHALKFAEGSRQKELTLSIIVGQALQGLSKEAEAGFAEFNAKYPKDPMAEAVPYFIARAMIQQNRFDEAIVKLRAIIKDTPNSRFAALSVQEIARALLGQKKTDEAIKEIEDFSAKIKSGKFNLPPDVLEDAERFRGYTLFQQGKKDEAIVVLKQLVSTAKNVALKQEVSYQVGNMLSTTGNFEESTLAMEDYLKTYPDSSNTQRAKLLIAGNYERLKKSDEALKAFQDILKQAEDPATKIFCLEKIWRIHLANERFEEMIAAQDEMITAFPQSPRTLVAYSERIKYFDRIKNPQETAAIQQKLMDAYAQMTKPEKDSEYGKALGAYVVRFIIRKADQDYKAALKLGPVASMDEAKKTTWLGLINSSQKALEQAIIDFPDSDVFGSLLRDKVDVMLLMIRSKTMEEAAAFTYLSELAGKQLNEVVKAQVLIARASLAYQLGQKAVAAKFYKDAIAQISSPQSIPWQEYERYGSILLENKDWDEAIIQFGKLRENFLKPDQAQAAAVYGLGAAHLGKNDTAKAQAFFTELKTKFPKSDKLLEADFAQALLNITAGRYDEAFDILKKVMNSPSASNETRARSLLEFGKALELIGDKKGKTKETFAGAGKPELDIFDLAAGYYLKVNLLYSSQVELCAESLYRLVVIKVKQGKTADARKYATELTTKFPASDWADKVNAALLGT